VLQGALTLRGDVHGPMGNASLAASGSAALATKGFARQRIAIDLKANGLPALRDARLAMDGSLNGAPLLFHAALGGGKTRNIDLTARWKSLNAKAALTMPQGGAIAGTANIALQKLADLAVFTGNAMTGAANAALTLKARGGKSDATLQVDVTGLKLGTVEAQKATIHGTAADLMGKPALGFDLTVQGVAAQGFKGDAQAHIDGALDRLGARLEATLKDADGGALKTQATATLNISKHQITLNTLDGNWRGTALKLDAPATFDLADGMAVDHLAAHLAGGTIAASGRISPKLALTASAHNIALENFRPFLPQVGAQGTISATAELTGSLAAPQGAITLQGRELRAAFSGRAVPAAAIDLRTQLAGDHATLNASVKAGTSATLTLDGSVPIAPTGAIALRANGTADLSLIDPFLAASGRRVRGTLTLNADIGGTMAVPRVTGSAKLAGGELQDYARGARIHDITATIQADGTRIRLVELTGHADPGTITGSGSIDLSAPGMPVDFTLHAQNARPIVSDLVTATLSGDVKLAGRMKGTLDLSGKLQIVSAEINLPENLPPEVAVLNVRRRGQAPPPPPAPSSHIGLDVDVRTTGHIFVRGHGLDADMGGAIHVGGTSTAPVITGGFRMNRGSYSVAGQTLDFTTGRIRFDGVGVRGRLDPTLEFVAQTVSGGVTATLTVTGYASAPKIALSSSPQLPQDEVVAHLLFQQSVKQLTPLQLASIAQALAAMGGVGGGFNPLGSVRKTLGLDRLAVGSANGGATGSQSQTTVEAGRYVMRNVYVGVKQNLSGGTQTQVQVDITRRLKAQATVATGTDATSTKGSATQDNGSSVGLSYQFEY
jgi:translocation and assembly module TamB